MKTLIVLLPIIISISSCAGRAPSEVGALQCYSATPQAQEWDGYVPSPRLQLAIMGYGPTRIKVEEALIRYKGDWPLIYEACAAFVDRGFLEATGHYLAREWEECVKRLC